MLIGSTSRMVNGKKAIKTIYWRVTNGKNNTDKKLIKSERTIKFSQPAVNSPLKINSDSKFERYDLK